MATPTQLAPLLSRPDGSPPDCCDPFTQFSADFLIKRIVAQKAKCGTAPIIGLSGGDEGLPMHGQLPGTPPKYFLVVTESASGFCEAGPGCIGYNPEGESHRETSTGTRVRTSNPRSRGTFDVPCLVQESGELHDDCNIWFYVNWNYSWSETSYQVVRSSGEPPAGHCKVLGSSTYTKTLSEEFTTELLNTVVDELLEACDWSSFTWNQTRISRYRFNVAGETECVSGTLNDGQGWSIAALRWLREDETTLTKRKLRYMVRAIIDDRDAPPETQYRVRWREMLVPETPEGEEPAAIFTEKEYIGAPMEGEWYFESEEYDVAPPEENGSIVLVGMPVRGSVSANIQVKGWALTKRGFMEYTPSGEIPRVYKRETASGSFPGCPGQQLASKSYSGFQRYTDEAVEVVLPSGGSYTLPASQDPTGNYDNQLSDDVKEGGQFSPPFPRGGAFTYRLALKDQNPAQRTFERQSICGTRTIRDTLSFQLSDEYTTQQLRDRVEIECAKEWGVPGLRRLNTYNDAGEVQTLQAAALYESPDEAYYGKQHLRYRLSFSIPWSFDSGQSFEFTWKVYTERFDTGEVSVQDQSESVLFSDGNTLVSETQWREIPAPEFPGRIWLGAFQGPEHPLFYDTRPQVERV